MEGRGGGLGCLSMHCVGCSHLLLNCARSGIERGTLCQGWIGLGMGMSGMDLGLDTAEEMGKLEWRLLGVVMVKVE